MRNRLYALGLAAALLLAVAPNAWARQARATGDWAAVQALSPGQKIIVRLKEGDRFTGTFDSATDLLLNFTDDGRKVSFTRESIRLVQINRGKSRWKGALLGAGIGGGSGLAFGGWAYDSADGDFVGAIVPVSAALGAVIGAGIGAAFGKGNRNETIYEAP